MKVKYTLGFIFSYTYREVLLILKDRSAQAGRWNGVGGKVEPNENSKACMTRECLEETGLSITDWQLVAVLEGTNRDDTEWTVDVYAATSKFRPWEAPQGAEKLDAFKVSEVLDYGIQRPYATHVRTLVMQAIDVKVNRAPCLVMVEER